MNYWIYRDGRLIGVHRITAANAGKIRHLGYVLIPVD